jgi:hypothetical protein
MIRNGVALDVMVCDCGFQMGFDSLFMSKVGHFHTSCPACKGDIDTAEVFGYAEGVRVTG